MDLIDEVQQTYLRLESENQTWENRISSWVLPSCVISWFLMAQARRGRQRGGIRVTLVEDLAVSSSAAAEPDLLDLDAALDELAALDERQAHLVELRFFGGLGIEESARALDISVATANRDWVTAKAWLFQRLKAGRRA